MSHLRRVQCGVCQMYFMTAQPAQKYCTPKCSKAAQKQKMKEWERKAKRKPHLYRKKKTDTDVQQFELPLVGDLCKPS